MTGDPAARIEWIDREHLSYLEEDIWEQGDRRRLRVRRIQDLLVGRAGRAD